MAQKNVVDELAWIRLAAHAAGLGNVQLRAPAHRHLKNNDGLSLHYLDWRDSTTANEPHLILLHGGGLNARTWDLVVLGLTGYNSIALDQRGHGDSDWSADGSYSPEDHARDIIALVDELGLERVTLVGQSMGGLNSIAVAARFPTRVDRLVLVESGPYPRDVGARRILDFMAGPDEMDSVDDFVERARTLRPGRDPVLLRRSLLLNLRQLPSGKWTWKYDGRFRGKSDSDERERRWRECMRDLERVTCPTLFVLGGRSDVFDEADARRIAAIPRRGTWTVVPGAGHNVQSDNPSGLTTVIGGFLAETG